jgi:hypothetical protein
MILTLKQAVEVKIDKSKSLAEILLENAYPAISLSVTNKTLLNGLKSLNKIQIAEQELAIVGVVASEDNIYTVYAMPHYVIEALTRRYNE